MTSKPFLRETRKRRVLVVDDQVDVADAFGSLLKSLGHEVRTASNAQAAMETMRIFQPEVALLDLSMPKVNGYELARQLRQEFPQPDLTLIAVTGHERHKIEAGAREAGFQHILLKPLDVERIAKLIDAAPGREPERSASPSAG